MITGGSRRNLLGAGALVALSASATFPLVAKPATKTVLIPKGVYQSFFPEAPARGIAPVTPKIAVERFELDIFPVTNSQFLDFVTKNPKWRRGQISALFASNTYLKHWTGPEELGPSAPADSPVVNVSWFAATAYCESQGKRLPTTAEWEYVGAPGQFASTLTDNPETIILEWYGRPTVSIQPKVGLTPPNRFGVYDLHGLVWEWTHDFNSIMITNDARGDSSAEEGLFCGAGALGGADPSAYSTYMRMAFRSSLKGGFSLGNLGFRCAK